MRPQTPVECWITARLTPDQYMRLQDIAELRGPEIDPLGAITLVPDLLRDMMAHALHPLLGELTRWEGGLEE